MLQNSNVADSHDESAVQGSSMRINSVADIDIFSSTREEGVYKDCQVCCLLYPGFVWFE